MSLTATNNPRTSVVPRAKFSHSAISISRYGLGALSQVAISLSNLFLSLALARLLTHADFGLYSNIFTAAFFSSGLFASAFTTQMTVRIARLSAPAAAVTIRQTHFLAALCLAALGVGAICALFIAWRCGELSDGLLICGAAIFASGVVVRDLSQATFFASRKPVKAFASAILGVSGTALAIALTAAAPSHWRLAVVLSISGIALFVSARLCGGYVPRIRLSQLPRIVVIARRLLQHGRWGVVQHLSISVRSYSYILVATYMLGLRAAGYVFSARLLASPIVLFGATLATIGLPFLSRAAAQNKNVPALTTALCAILASGCLLYCTAALWARPWIGKLLPATTADPHFWTEAFIWFAIGSVSVMQTAIGTALRALMQFRHLGIVNIAAALIGAPALLIATRWEGATGLLYVLFVSELALLAVFSARLVQAARA